MIPARPDGDCAASEKALFQRLAEALPGDWTVFHSRTIVLPADAKDGKRECEIDFLILDPERGLLALEVKGGEVRRDSDDLWYSIDRNGEAHEIHNPQKQVTRDVRLLRDWLKSQQAVANLWLPISWAVAFPDVTITRDLGSELPRELIIDRKDLDDLATAIDRIFTAHSLTRNAAPVSTGVRASNSAPETSNTPSPRHPEPAKRGEGSQTRTTLPRNSEEARGTRGTDATRHPEPAKRGEGSQDSTQQTRQGPPEEFRGTPRNPRNSGAQLPTRLLIDLLAPTMRLMPTLADRMAETDAQLVRLTAEQARILDFMGSVARLKVRGTAGSGKTLIAKERARREAALGKRVLFLCYNTLLAHWLRADGNVRALEGTGGVRASKPAPGATSSTPAQDAGLSTQHSVTDDVNPQPGTITLLTFHDLAKKLAKAAKLRFNPEDAEDSRAFWADTAPDLLMQALEKLPDHRWDSIVIDEAQDFRELWWLAIEKAGAQSAPLTQSPVPSPQSSSLPPRNSEELRGTRGTPTALWAFYDPHQDIYAASAMDELIAQEAELVVNCRNTARIAEQAFAEIGEQPTLKDDTPAGVPVETIKCSSDAEMKDAIRRAVHKLVSEEKLDPSRIVLLTAKNKEKSVLHNATLGNLKVVDWPAQGTNEIGYCSLQRFKGLEADVILLCEVDRAKTNGSAKHLYVAQSRARHILVDVEYRA